MGKENDIRGRWLEWHSYRSNAISIKKELLVSAAAINPITVITDIPCDPISLVPIRIRT